jgi:photosystem II stability/assembly factor-like uncharacterized protein
LPSNRARFTADGQTAYIAADILGDGSENVYSYFYALDTAPEGATPNTPPRVTMTSPAHNAEVSMGTRLDIKASAQDDGGIDRVEFFYGTTTGTLTLIGTDASADADGLYGVQFTPTTPGSHSFVAVAYDAAGLSGKSSANIWVTDRPPTVFWVAPTNGSGFAAPESITLVARAADSDGAVTGVEFKSYQAGVVGYNVIGSDTTPDSDGTYQILWAKPPQGTYEITATATDNSGLSRGAVITVTIAPASMPKYTIGGTVRDPGGSPMSGVNVTLGNSVSAATTTGADGSYQFSDLQGGGSYTVTASRAGYSFSPPQHVFSGLGSNQTANFTGTRDTHAIGGQIKDNNNVGLSEVALTVSDGQTTTTFYTGANGNYSFPLPAGGNYTVTPTLVNYTFAPVSLSFNNLSAAQTANFTGTRNTHGISGRVLANGYTLSGVTIALTGSQTGTATTDPSGYFSFNLPAGGTYTVTPSLSGYVFSPASLTFSNLSGNVSGSFTAASTNQPPRVTLMVPANGATFAAPAAITVSADASDPDGTISKVEFFAEYKTGPFTFQTIPLGSDTTAPYSATFTYSGADSFNLRAVATDDRGDWKPSEPAFVTFTLGEASQTPGWQKQFAAARPGLNGAPFETLGFSAVDGRHAWASHINAKVSRTTDGGLTWDTVEVQIDGGNNNHAQDVDFIDTQTGWVVGGEDNAVLRSTDGGRTFVRQPTGLSASLFGVEAVDVNTAFAVGHGYTERDGPGPVVLRTRDGGATWVEIAHPFRFLTRGSFYAVHFINQATGWAVGGSGIALKTTDGGSTWTDVRVPTELPLSDVSFADANNGWAVGHGGVIFRTADGGATWRQQNVGTGDAILSVSAVSPTVAWIACYGTPGFVARTTDGGVKWHREYPDAAPNGNPGGVSSYSAVLFFNAENGWAAGYGGIYRRGAAPEPPANYSLSGRVAGGADAGLAGVTVTLSGAQSAGTQTDAQGNYSFGNLVAGGTYTITPSLGGYTFAPSSRTLSNISRDEAADFNASLVVASTPTPTPVPSATPAPTPTPVEINDSADFVAQHYRDFLGREADPAGLAHWTNEIESCGVDAQCREVRRVNVSAAFFLSIEFQQTGYLAFRARKVTFGDAPGEPVPVSRAEMLEDLQVVASGVVVGVENWEQRLEQNKRDYFDRLATSARFTALYPQALSPEAYVGALNQNAGGALSQAERDALVSEMRSNTKTRAQALRAVAEDADLSRAEFNKAFVLMQFFGYLRRDPDEAPDSDFSGFNFWLTKLDAFNGNYVQAEMVKAFLESTEYRKRFGQ